MSVPSVLRNRGQVHIDGCVGTAMSTDRQFKTLAFVSFVLHGSDVKTFSERVFALRIGCDSNAIHADDFTGSLRRRHHNGCLRLRQRSDRNHYIRQCAEIGLMGNGREVRRTPCGFTCITMVAYRIAETIHLNDTVCHG